MYEGENPKAVWYIVSGTKIVHKAAPKAPQTELDAAIQKQKDFTDHKINKK